MLVTRVILKNWRNFREADVPLREQTYLLGANASGKSNFLDVFRFLRDVSKPQGGGFQGALALRDGLSKLRCLHARKDTAVGIEIHLAESSDSKTPDWRYILAFNFESRGARRPLVTTEEVWKGKERLLHRPDDDDKRDVERRTQTHLEQIQANAKFREIANFFSDAMYLHLVPQLLKYGERIGGKTLENDPFGQDFLERIAKTSPKKRKGRLNKIQKALKLAVPQFVELDYAQDEVGHPHLKARYAHHRPHGGFQSEEQFSDGTLRLIGILWSILEDDALLLLEEPELSLNDSIVEQIPVMLHRIQVASKRHRQVIVSTHSEALLRNPGIDGKGVLLLEPGQEGTTIRSINKEETLFLKNGLSVAETVLPKTRPETAKQLAFWQ